MHQRKALPTRRRFFLTTPPFGQQPGPIRALLTAVLLGCSMMASAGPAAASSDPTAISAQAAEAYNLGQAARAAQLWAQAAQAFAVADQPAQRADCLRYQAAALRDLGHFDRSRQLLADALPLVQDLHDPARVAAVHNDLGGLAILTRDFDHARSYLDQALAMATETGDLHGQALAHNSLGNLHSALSQHDQAIQNYLLAIDLARQADDASLEARATVNALGAAVDSGAAGDDARTPDLIHRSMTLLNNRPDTHEKAYLLIAAGSRSLDWARTRRSNQNVVPHLESALRAAHSAARVARQISDTPTLGEAIGLEAQVYESQGRWAEALETTRRAAFIAQQTQSPHALYRWQWQKGRIFRGMGRLDEAVKAYRRAVWTLDTVRQDVTLGYGNRPSAGGFRAEIGQLYYGLADLLLQQAHASPDPAEAQQLLREAREIIERFKSAELVDYFQDECVGQALDKHARIEDVSPTTAVVYIIPLPDRVELLVGFNDGLQPFTVAVTSDQLMEEVRQFRKELEDLSTRRHLQQAQQLYTWLIAPIQAQLDQRRIDTLVFVPDGPLRLVPMAALHDGQRFLIETYATAVAPGLTLVDPKPIDVGHTRLLAGGLSLSVHEGFPALPNVPEELEQVTTVLGGKELLDNQFVLPRLEDEVAAAPYTIVHIASHGQFGSSAAETFILTYDTKLTLSGLERLIRPARFRNQPVELLTLSACQTAAGDDRSALGLAGVALKAGARSALATLWPIQDRAAAMLITEFYKQIRADPTITKAKALQAAQVKAIQERQYDDPFYWAPFLIVGNWL